MSGALVVYERFTGYVPRADGLATFTAGPKRVHYDRVEWHVLPDAGTAASALIKGEVDWWQSATPDLLPFLRSCPEISLEVLDLSGGIGCLRFSHLFPPFDNLAVRRALLGAVDQEKFMTAVTGAGQKLWRDRVGVFSPGTPMATETDTEALVGDRDFAQVREDLRHAGYRGERVVLLDPVDIPTIHALAMVAADALRQSGMDVDVAAADWGTLVQRRASRQPPDRGGWNAFVTYLNGTNNLDPASRLGIRGNGDQAWFGWPRAPKLETLRAAWFNALNLSAQKQICAEIQLQFFEDTPYLPLGALYDTTAYRGLQKIRTGFAQFYDVRPA